VNGWVQRHSVGLGLQDTAHAPEPGVSSPPQLPADQKLVAPFVRHELIEDRFQRELNRDLIGRPEFFALGLHSTLQLGRASTGLGSSRNAWLYSASISRGFEPTSDHMLIATARLNGQRVEGHTQRQRLGVQAQSYLRHGEHRLFYAAMSADMLTRPNPEDLLLLGGDSGLRGYPLRYQSGTRRALFTVEERFYTDLYLWQLFRIGGAAYVDAGRAWGGQDFGNLNTINPGWLANAGVGLRIVSARAAFSNVLHVDVAFPLNATSDIKKVQFLVKSKTSF
jgi:hemolysin activation/secretion protein